MFTLLAWIDGDSKARERTLNILSLSRKREVVVCFGSAPYGDAFPISYSQVTFDPDATPQYAFSVKDLPFSVSATSGKFCEAGRQYR